MHKLQSATAAQQEQFNKAYDEAAKMTAADKKNRYVFFVPKSGQIGIVETMHNIEVPHVSVLVHAS